MQLRKATLADREAVLEICKTIWDGDDYIPNIFDLWANDPNGEFTLITEEGTITGMARFSISQPGTGWLEGLRVAPEARSRGYAKVITRYYIEKGREMGLDRLQLSTYFQNDASIHVTESYGFQRVATFFLEEKTIDPHTLPTPHSPVIRADLHAPECAAVIGRLLASPEQWTQKGFLGFGWSFRSLNENEVREAIALGNVYYLRENHQVEAAIWVYPDHVKDETYYVVMVTGSDQGISQLLDWACMDAAQRGFNSVSAMVPEEEHLIGLYLNKGYGQWEDFREPSVFIYELPLKEEEDA